MRLFRILAASLTILLSFGGTFFFSAYPDLIEKVFHSRPLRVGLAPEISLPASVRRVIFEISGKVLIPVSLESRENWLSETTDLDIVPRGWINPTDLEIRSEKFFRSLVSADFCFEDPLHERSLPLFWNLNSQDKITLHYLVVKNPFRIDSALIQTLTGPVVQTLWLTESKSRSTLLISNDLSLTEETKAGFIRTLDLRKTHVENYFGQPVTTTTTTTTTTLPPKMKLKPNSNRH